MNEPIEWYFSATVEGTVISKYQEEARDLTIDAIIKLVRQGKVKIKLSAIPE